MLLSMTGYGQASTSYKEKIITIEIRSLNSKFTDLRFKLPQNYKDIEAHLRKVITQKAERGKIDVSLSVKSLAGDDEYALNLELFRKYYQELQKLAQSLQIPPGDIIQSILRLPNVVSPDQSTIEEDEWTAVKDATRQALEALTQFRIDEGSAMEQDCRLRIQNILTGLQSVAPHEAGRITKIRQRMLQNMQEYLSRNQIDENRFEQEILYYLEKIDITEEKVRLKQHCKYFQEVLDTPQTLKGRKLSFISQEIGREINTLGSKASSSDIQRIVVNMKDDLEKIKEQVANSL